jgi:adenosylcobinamide amidohydrolase
MDDVEYQREARLLCARLGPRHRVLSHAVLRPGLVEAERVVWCQVRDDELAPPVDPARHLHDRLSAAGLADAVGLLTGADLGEFVDVTRAIPGLAVRVVATVGLDNARRAGDRWDVPPSVTGADRTPSGPGSLDGTPPPAGTINVLACASLPLSDGALIEMLAIAAEARAMAVLEGDVVSRRSGRPATGTGTDCTVVAAPCGTPGLQYAGKHTALGHLVGAAVAEAVGRGVGRWLERHPSRRGNGGAA